MSEQINPCTGCGIIPRRYKLYAMFLYYCPCLRSKARSGILLIDWNAINPLPTPNAGEKCPVCDGHGALDDGHGEYDCRHCQGTGLKPAVESEHKMKCGVCGEVFDMRRLDEVAFHETHT